MSAAIAHRGPDGEGVYFDRDPDDLSNLITPDRPQIALAFRRLAVLDPTPCSDQPFVSTDGRYVLVFNGEIYNFKDLKSEISNLRSDYVWRTTGDTEVLMMAFAVWGDRCVDRLNGMFAFAVWDHQERSLFLARDRMGQKPLYTSTAVGCPCPAIAFGSEFGAIQHVAWFERDESVDRAGIRSFLASGNVNWQTLHAGTAQVRPGTFEEERYIRSAGGTYFLPGDGCACGTGVPPVAATQSPEKHGRNAHAATTTRTVRAAVERAVERQLVSDVPLGVFLSGGVDSSVIARCARKHVGKLKTFSIAFDDPRYDESKFAREVATHLGTDHHEFRVTPNVIEDLPKLAAVFGEPFADSSALPTHYLARETRKHVTVALSGDGGDELFGGYDRYVAMREAARVPRAIGALLAPLVKPFLRGHPKSNLTRLARFVSTLSLSPADRYDALMRVFDDETMDALLDSGGRQSPAAIRSSENVNGGRGLPPSSIASTFKSQFARTRNVVTAALATDRATYLPGDLLTKVDRCSMLHGLEVRSPFMDHEVVELAAQLTEDELLKGGKKRMLREAFASELPDFVFKRPKMGFAVPIGEWFRGPLRAFLRDHLFAADSFARGHFKMPVVERLVNEHETSRRDHAQRLYALLMLELWWDLQQGVTP